MFDNLCFWKASKWEGISYAGGGMNTNHSAQVCVRSNHDAQWSDRNMVKARDTQLVIAPKSYMLGTCVYIHFSVCAL